MTMPKIDTHKMYPVAIIQDRYGGCYSGGAWLAIAQADEGDRMARCFNAGPHGDDCDAMEYWESPPFWISAGHSPEDAVTNLAAKIESLEKGACTNCGRTEFLDPETRNFVVVRSGGSSSGGHDVTTHWAAGWIVCAHCGHTEWHHEST